MKKRRSNNGFAPLKIPVPKLAEGDASDDLVLETTIPYQINRLAFHMNQLLEDDLRAHDLSMSNWRVMAVLDFNSSATVNQLADYAMIEQSTLSRLLRRMERDGDIEIRPSDDDGRVRMILLTAQGKQRYEVVKGLTMQHVSRILHGMSHDDRAQLLSSVTQMQHNVETRDLED